MAIDPIARFGIVIDPIAEALLRGSFLFWICGKRAAGCFVLRQIVTVATALSVIKMMSPPG
jgi:hypothetical protein